MSNNMCFSVTVIDGLKCIHVDLIITESHNIYILSCGVDNYKTHCLAVSFN